MQVDDLPPDHLTRRAALIGAVKIDDVRRIARRVLRDEAMTTIVVGKPVGVAARSLKGSRMASIFPPRRRT